MPRDIVLTCRWKEKRASNVVQTFVVMRHAFIPFVFHFSRFCFLFLCFCFNEKSEAKAEGLRPARQSRRAISMARL